MSGAAVQRLNGLALLLGIALPDAASACTPDPCAGVVAFAGLEPVSEAEVPIDGVVILQADWFGELEPPTLLDGLSLSVSRDGAAVAGALESTDLPGVLLWRPAAPLVPGATYTASGSFANGGGVPGECAAAEVEVGFEFTAAAGPAEPLADPEITAWAEYVDFPIVALDTLVCCDDAMPREQRVCGISHGLAWSQGKCAPARTRALLRVELRAAIEVGEATAAQWVWTLEQDGKQVATGFQARFTRYLAAPACFTVVLRSLATGEARAAEEQCFGQDVVEPLGEVPLDPRERLADACTGALYTCAAEGGAWDPEACAPWTPEERPGGARTGCARGGPVLAGGWLGLWMLPRRRRARARRRG